MTKLAEITHAILNMESPPLGGYAVTPGPNDLPTPLRGFMVTVAGNVEVQFWDGANRTGDILSLIHI